MNDLMNDSEQQFWNDAYREDPEQVAVADYFLEEELAGIPPRTALDLGCGSGQNALWLAARGWSVVGVDWAEYAIDLARKAAQAQGLEATFYVGDITNWTPTATFNLVINTYALPGGAASQQTLQTAQKALAPGGLLLVAEWDKSMAEGWGFSEGDLLSPPEIAELLPELTIERAHVLRIENAFPDDDPRAQHSTFANIALVRGRKPK